MKDQAIVGSVLVIGAGELGHEVLVSLAARASGEEGVSVSALVRSSSPDDHAKQQQLALLRSHNIGLIEGDIVSSSVETLAALFEPFDTVICCVGFSAGAGVQTRITEAVVRANIKRYVPWQFGVDYDTIGRGSAQDVFDEQLDVRDILRAQANTQWLIIATGMFTSFLFEPAFGVVDIEQSVVRALGDWDNRVTVTTPEDIGRLTAEILFHAPPLINQTVFVAGDTVSYAELAQALEQHYQRSFTREGWSLEQLHAALEQAPDDNLLKYRAVFGAGVGVAWPKESTFNAQFGIASVDVPAWMAQHLPVTAAPSADKNA